MMKCHADDSSFSTTGGDGVGTGITTVLTDEDVRLILGAAAAKQEREMEALREEVRQLRASETKKTPAAAGERNMDASSSSPRVAVEGGSEVNSPPDNVAGRSSHPSTSISGRIRSTFRCVVAATEWPDLLTGHQFFLFSLLASLVAAACLVHVGHAMIGASTTNKLDVACAGPALLTEIEGLGASYSDGARPVFGAAKEALLAGPAPPEEAICSPLRENESESDTPSQPATSSETEGPLEAGSDKMEEGLVVAGSDGGGRHSPPKNNGDEVTFINATEQMPEEDLQGFEGEPGAAAASTSEVASETEASSQDSGATKEEYMRSEPSRDRTDTKHTVEESYEHKGALVARTPLTTEASRIRPIWVAFVVSISALLLAFARLLRKGFAALNALTEENRKLRDEIETLLLRRGGDDPPRSTTNRGEAIPPNTVNELVREQLGPVVEALAEIRRRLDAPPAPGGPPDYSANIRSLEAASEDIRRSLENIQDGLAAANAAASSSEDAIREVVQEQLSPVVSALATAEDRLESVHCSLKNKMEELYEVIILSIASSRDSRGA